MLRLRPTRPDLCQHDSGLLRLYNLFRDLVSFFSGVYGLREEPVNRTRCCRSGVVGLRRRLGGTVSLLAS